eukprot:4057539-Ditylum_brightwellii.AAC.1
MKVLQKNSKWKKKKKRMNQLNKCVDLPYLPNHGLVGKSTAWAKYPSQLSCNVFWECVAGGIAW